MTGTVTIDRYGPLPSFLDGDPTAPVTWFQGPTGDELWLVSGYDLGRQVLTDRRFSRAAASRPDAPKLSTSSPAPTSLMSMDGADHARLRKLVAGAFSPRRIAALAPSIQTLVDELLDDMHRTGPPIDLVAAFAAPLPLIVASTLLGIPAEDRDGIRDWAGVLFDMTASSPADKARRSFALYVYMTKLLDRKAREPADDLLSDLALEHAAGALAKAELVDLALAMLTAGYETTVGQIGLTVLSTLGDPQIAAPACPYAPASVRRPDLAQNPEIEEYLRLTPATPLAFPRVALEDVDLGGVTIKAGQAVIVSLLHANRDATVFVEPNLVHGDGRPAHLTFGHGAHYCLGASLARLQLDIAMRGLTNRFPSLRVAPGADAVAWHDGFATRALSRLLVEWS